MNTIRILDQNHLTAKQISQMLWYFLEGYSIRRDETPALNDARFVQYQVVMPSLDKELVFWKSRVTERWWMEFAGETENQFLWPVRIRTMIWR